MKEADKFQAPSAAPFLRAAESLHHWCSNHNLALQQFSHSIVRDIRQCLDVKKDKMWSRFHEVRTSSHFRMKWEVFLSASVGDFPPTFFQYVTDSLFKVILAKSHQATPSTSSSALSPSPLSSEEQNALRYVGGYVVRNILKQYKRNADNEISDEEVLLYSFSGDEATDNSTERWTNSLDRGGLWHIKDSVYALFYSFEEELRCLLQTISLQSYGQTTELGLIDSLLTNEEILFHWSLLTPEIDDAKGMVVLKKIVKLYITTRGHAFASSFMELYKQEKKTLQKKKPLRSELYHHHD